MQHRRGNEQYGSGITFIGILQVSDTLLYKGRVLLHDAKEAMQHRRGNEQSERLTKITFPMKEAMIKPQLKTERGRKHLNIMKCHGLSITMY